MGEARWTVGEVAQLAQVTVRTLHHYDAIGLLSPSSWTESGYRLYRRADLERLHLIGLYRQVGMPLEQIKKILDDRSFDRNEALRLHRKRLAAQVTDLGAQISILDRMLNQKGEKTMGEREIFVGAQPAAWAEEAAERWGETDAWKVSQQRARGHTPADWAAIHAERDAIEAELAACLQAGLAPESGRAAVAAERHRLHIERWFYPCSPEMHASLGAMYVEDARFAAHYDKRLPGLAAYVSAAITASAGRPA